MDWAKWIPAIIACIAALSTAVYTWLQMRSKGVVSSLAQQVETVESEVALWKSRVEVLEARLKDVEASEAECRRTMVSLQVALRESTERLLDVTTELLDSRRHKRQPRKDDV